MIVDPFGNFETPKRVYRERKVTRYQTRWDKIRMMDEGAKDG